jgi:hypothetical protein
MRLISALRQSIHGTVLIAQFLEHEAPPDPELSKKLRAYEAAAARLIDAALEKKPPVPS